MVVTGARACSQKNQKCLVCDKRHYPFYKSIRGVCNVCKKKHQPFCKRKGDTSHPVIDTASLQETLKGMPKHNKAKFAASIVANFESPFWISNDMPGGANAE